MSGPHPSSLDLPKGATIYITISPGTREHLLKTCKPLTVQHCTDKAVLVTCGDSEQWLPLKALTCSSNTEGVYLLARWMKLSKPWRARTGTPVEALRTARPATR